MADNFIVRSAEILGTAYNRYIKAKNDGLLKKPEFMAGLAQETKWKGGQTAQEDYAQRRALRNNWFFSGVNAKAMDLSSSKLDIYNNPSGLEDDGVKAEGHPFLNVWRRPNRYMGNALMMQYTQWWLDLKGEAYIFIEPDGNNGIRGLWPLPANAMDIEFTDDNKDVKNYILKLQQWYRIDPNYIIYIRLPNPFDFFRGMSVLVAQMLTIDIDLAMKTWNGAFFGKDNVMPSAIISLGSGDPQNAIEPKDLEVVTDQLKSEYSAVRRKTIVTNANSMAVALLGYNAKDMDFMSGMQWNKEEILIGIGVPPGMMDKNATEANATVAKAVFKENMWGIKNLIADEITNQCLKIWYSDTLEARYQDDRVLDRKARLEEAKQAESVMTIDEIRTTYYQLEPLPAGQMPANKFGTVADPNHPANDPNSQLNKAKFGGQGDIGKVNTPAGKGEMKPVDKKKNPVQKSIDSIDDELELYMRKAVKHFKQDRLVGMRFFSTILNEETIKAIQADLDGVERQEDIAEVFGHWRDSLAESFFKGGVGSGENDGHPFRGNQYGYAIINPDIIIDKKIVMRNKSLMPLSNIKSLSWRPWSNFESQLQDVIYTALQSQLAILLANASANLMADAGVWQRVQDALLQTIKPVFMQIVDQALTDTVEMLSQTQVSISYELTKPFVQEWANRHAGDQIKAIDDTTKKAVQKQISEWQTGPERGIGDLKDRISNLQDENGQPLFDKARADRIARSEATSIYAGATEQSLVHNGYPPAVFKPRAHVNCRCYIQGATLDSGEKVIVWYTVKDELVCTVDIETPFGTVSGCKELHRTIVSDGHAGEQWTGNLWNPESKTLEV